MNDDTCLWTSTVRVAAHLLRLLLLGLLLFACDRDGEGTTPAAGDTLPPLELREETPDLLLTWIDERGGAHTEVAVGDVPEPGRKLVRVMVASRKEGLGSRFYVADLSQKQDDGRFAVRTMLRSEWEAELERRRAAYLARNAPPAIPTASAGSAGSAVAPPPTMPDGLVVIVYGADWCKPCHMAMAHLRKRGVKAVEKDIDRDAAAQAEMARKLARAGKSGAAIPVIDVAGQILVGFEARALDDALRRARSPGTAL